MSGRPCPAALMPPASLLRGQVGKAAGREWAALQAAVAHACIRACRGGTGQAEARREAARAEAEETGEG